MFHAALTYSHSLLHRWWRHGTLLLSQEITAPKSDVVCVNTPCNDASCERNTVIQVKHVTDTTLEWHSMCSCMLDGSQLTHFLFHRALFACVLFVSLSGARRSPPRRR